MNKFLKDLNDSQKLAVEATEGPVMIIAGAGSGKTRVLTYRIAHLLTKGIDAYNILSLTFTNKSASEMKERIEKIVGSDNARDIWSGTFHSVFSKILRYEANKIGYDNNFLIQDAYDSRGAIKEVLRQLGLDEKIYKPSVVLARISDAKNKLMSASEYSNNEKLKEEDKKNNIKDLWKVYLLYQKNNFKSNSMDFDDLLFNTCVLLKDFPDVLLRYQNKFRYILVDEYQDTNLAQYEIINLLARRFNNICVVGDDAQSIYAFRGANIENILNFEKDYPRLQTFKLEQNYRSTKNIVGAANLIIKNNKEQLSKNVFSENEQGEKIKIIQTSNDREEGDIIAKEINEIKTENRAKNKDFAILYRTNAQSMSFEKSLKSLNLPYYIHGGTSFYQRKEIKDVLAYCRLVINVDDDESLRRVINYPARGIGKTTIDKLSIAAMEHDISVWTVIENIKDFNGPSAMIRDLGINSGIQNKIIDFVSVINSCTELLTTKNAYDLANEIASRSGMMKEFHEDKTQDGISRFENVKELFNGIKDFTEKVRTPQEEELNRVIKNSDDENYLKLKTLDEFMQDISLMTNFDKDEDGKQMNDKISLMTVHSSKGLEFPYVFVVGMEENLFPSQLSMANQKELEEERRLFYVAITRAEKTVTLSFANSRFKFGEMIYCEPSRFLDEIGEEFSNIAEFTNKNESAFNRKEAQFRTFNSVFDEEVNKNLKVGDKVLHDKFGEGEVMKIDGIYPSSKAVINFKEGAKDLLLKFVKLIKNN